MMRAARAVILALALTATALPGRAEPRETPARPRNPQIETVLVRPKTPRFVSIHDALKEREALETLREFLAPLRLDRKLTIRIDECQGRQRAAYDPRGIVTLCYEYIAMIEDMAPVNAARIGTLSIGRQLIINGAFAQLALREVAYAVLDILQIPVWGHLDDAADNVAGVIMVNFGDDVALVTLLGASWVFAQQGFWGTGDFTDVARAVDVQRFYNQLCIAYGAKPNTFAFLVKNANLPTSRAERCASMYRKLWISFKQTILPRVDRQLLEQALKRDWGARLGIDRTE